MKLDDLKAGLQNFLTDEAQKQGCMSMLAEFGLVPKADQKDRAEVEKIKTEAKNEGIKEGRETEAVRVKGILNACNLGGRLDMAESLIETGVSAEDAGKKIIEAKANAADQVTTVTSTVGAVPKDSNPLMADAVRRAEQAKS